MGHDRLTEYLELVRGEYEALQAECMVVKGQRDEFEKQSESCEGGDEERVRSKERRHQDNPRRSNPDKSNTHPRQYKRRSRKSP